MGLKGKIGQSSVTRASSDGGFADLRTTRDGSLFTHDWIQGLISEGRGYTSIVGTFSTPITGGGSGATVIDLDQPNFALSIPDGMAILPFRISVQIYLGAIATTADEAEILVTADRVTATAFDGTWTDAVIYNLRTDKIYGSACTAKKTCIGDTTDPVHHIDLARLHTVAELRAVSTIGAFWQPIAELLYEPKYPPILMGPASLYVYWGGTVANKGFAQVQWVELPETAFV